MRDGYKESMEQHAKRMRELVKFTASSLDTDFLRPSVRRFTMIRRENASLKRTTRL
jgi:hypothetical protein